MSEATETILSAARERIAVLEAEIAEFEAEGRREEIKNLQSVVSTLSKTNKPGRGRPKKDRAEEIKNVLTKVGRPLSADEIAARLGTSGTRNPSVQKTLETSEMFAVADTATGDWTLVS
jgi:hypothetical protein